VADIAKVRVGRLIGHSTTSYLHNVIAWSLVLLEKLMVSQLVRLRAFYGTWKFITVFTRAQGFYGEEFLASRPIPKL